MTTLTLGDLQFEVRRSDRRRTLGLTVERDGSLVLSAPPDVAEARLERFAKQKRFWVYQKLAAKEALPPALPVRKFVTGEGFAAYRYRPTAARRLGTALLRRSMRIALRRPFLDATSGMYAANAKALPVLARPYTSEAPEVQALLRLQEAGLRVDEVPVDMRPRSSGESKLQGKKAVMVVLTVAGTLLALDRWGRRG